MRKRDISPRKFAKTENNPFQHNINNNIPNSTQFHSDPGQDTFSDIYCSSVISRSYAQYVMIPTINPPGLNQDRDDGTALLSIIYMII